MIEDKPVIKKDMVDSDMDITNRSIDLVRIFKKLWVGRKIIFLSAIFFLLVGIIIALISPVKYSASAVILPSTEAKVGGLGSLGALAGMAGVNISSMLGQGNSFDPALYPQIAASTPFLLELMNKKIYWKKYNESLSYFEYLERQDKKESIGKSILKYTINLPATIRELLSPSTDNNTLSTENTNGYYTLSESQVNAMNNLSNLISVNYQKSTGLITLSVSLGEALAVAQLTQNALELFQKYIVNYKIKKVSANLAFLENRGEEKRMEYEAIQNKLMSYKDTHRNMIRERTDFEFQKLSDSYDITVNVYKGLMQSIEQSRIAVKEETPAFSIIMPVVLPTQKDSPKRGIIVVGMLAMGFFFGVCFLYFLIFLFDFLDREQIAWIKTQWILTKIRHIAGIV